MEVITQSDRERKREADKKYKRLRKINVPKVDNKKALFNQQQQLGYNEPSIDWSRKLGVSPRKLSPTEKQFHFDNKPFDSAQSEYGDSIERFLSSGGVIKRQPNEVPIDPFDYLNGIDVDAGDVCV